MEQEKKHYYPFSWIIGLVIALLVVIFALQNSDLVTISFYWAKVELPLVILLFTVLIIGALITVLMYIPYYVRKRKKINFLKNELKEIEEKLAKANQQKKVSTQ